MTAGYEALSRKELELLVHILLADARSLEAQGPGATPPPSVLDRIEARRGLAGKLTAELAARKREEQTRPTVTPSRVTVALDIYDLAVVVQLLRNDVTAWQELTKCPAAEREAIAAHRRTLAKRLLDAEIAARAVDKP